MLTASLSDESAILWFIWWWIGEDVLCRLMFPTPVTSTHSAQCVSLPFPSSQRLTHVWWLAGRRVTLQTRYFLRMVPQCVTSTFKPGESNRVLGEAMRMCLQYKWLFMVRVSLTRHDAYLFCLSYSLFSIYSTFFPPMFFTFNFFGEFDPVWVCEWARLLIYVVDVQHFTHELNDWLGLVESGGRNCIMKQRQESFKVTTRWRTITLGKYSLKYCGA